MFICRICPTIYFISSFLAVTRQTEKALNDFAITHELVVELDRAFRLDALVALNQPRPMATRRVSVAGGSLFSVRGHVTEAGSDFLPRIFRSNRVQIKPAADPAAATATAGIVSIDSARAREPTVGTTDTHFGSGTDLVDFASLARGNEAATGTPINFGATSSANRSESMRIDSFDETNSVSSEGSTARVSDDPLETTKEHEHSNDDDLNIGSLQISSGDMNPNETRHEDDDDDDDAELSAIVTQIIDLNPFDLDEIIKSLDESDGSGQSKQQQEEETAAVSNTKHTEHTMKEAAGATDVPKTEEVKIFNEFDPFERRPRAQERRRAFSVDESRPSYIPGLSTIPVAPLPKPPKRRTSTYEPPKEPLEAVTRRLDFGDDDCQEN